MEYQGFSLKSSNGKCLLDFGLISLILFSFLFVGCGASKNVKMAQSSAQEGYHTVKPILVRTSAHDQQRPAWTTKTFIEKDGKIHFSGFFMNGSDLSVTSRLANSEALKVAIQSIGQFVRAEFSGYASGDPTSEVNRYIEDGIASFSRLVHVPIRQKKIYYEEFFSPTTMQSTYNVWVALEMSKADYLHAKADVVRRLKDQFGKAGQSEAKDKANKLLEDLKREITKSA